MSNKAIQLFVLPVSDRVVFPYQNLHIRIPDTFNYDMK